MEKMGQLAIPHTECYVIDNLLTVDGGTSVVGWTLLKISKFVPMF